MEIRASKTDFVKIGNRFENISDLDIHTINIVQEEHNNRILRSSKVVKEEKSKVDKLRNIYLKAQENLLNAELELAEKERTNNFLKIIGTKFFFFSLYKKYLNKIRQTPTNGIKYKNTKIIGMLHSNLIKELYFIITSYKFYYNTSLSDCNI